MSRDFSALLWVACFHLKVCACATSTVWVPVLNLVLMPQRLSMVNESVIHLSFGILLLIRPSEKNTCFSSPPASVLAPPLFFFLLFFYEQRFYEQKPTGVTCQTVGWCSSVSLAFIVVTCKAHCCCVRTKIM